MRTKRAPFGVAVGAALALVSQRAWAEELSAESSADRAVRASYEAAAARSAGRSAQARVDDASYAFLPRLGLSARYVRLSDFTPSPLFPFAIAATGAPTGTVSPPTVSTGPVSIAPLLDSYALDATLTLPVSDYVLRLARGLQAAKHGRDAAEWDSVVAAARARLAGKISFYEWIRANASVDAAQRSLAEARAHLADVKNQFAQGNTSRADVLRVDSAVASAEAALAEAGAQRATAEARLRTLLHLPEAEPLSTRDGVSAPLGLIAQNEAEWLSEAYRTRAELHGLDAAESSARAQAGVARAAYVPTAGVFANATYANPNPRYFPSEAAWQATWAVGVSSRGLRPTSPARRRARPRPMHEATPWPPSATPCATRSRWRSCSTSNPPGPPTRRSSPPTSSSRARRRPTESRARSMRMRAPRPATCSTRRRTSPAPASPGSTLASMHASRARGSSTRPGAIKARWLRERARRL